jgi:hypothetical protein
MKTKHLSLTLQETPSKMLCPPSSLQSPYILSEILPIWKTKMLNFFPTFDAKSLRTFSGTKIPFLLVLYFEKIQTSLFGKKIFLQAYRFF